MFGKLIRLIYSIPNDSFHFIMCESPECKIPENWFPEYKYPDYDVPNASQIAWRTKCLNVNYPNTNDPNLQLGV